MEQTDEKAHSVAQSCYSAGFLESIQRVIHGFEPPANRLGRSADANAEVLAKFKEFAGHDTGFEPRSKQVHELLGNSLAKTRKDRGTKLACVTENLGVLAEEVVEQRPIRVEETAGSSTDGVQMIEANNGHAFCGVNRASIGEVNDLPHPADHAGIGENPAAANSAQAVSLGQAAGDNEVGTEMESGSPRAIEQGLKVDFVDEYACAHFGCHLADLPHGFVIGERAAGVVKIAEDEEARFRGDFAFEFSEPDAEAVIGAAFEAGNVGAEMIEYRQERIVGGAFNQDLIARTDER